MDDLKIAIVTVGYNRPDSMKKLLSSVLAAEYYEDTVDLVVSIDKGEKQSEIVKVAEEINWKHGEKIIRAFPERQGLRAHILQCGDLTEKYDAVVVLEDDLMVSPYFFSYVRQTIEFYEDKQQIAGISLYKHLTHPGVNRPFEPVNNGYDAYLMQFAQSWGQCWTRSMWEPFKAWYLKNEEADLSAGNLLPDYVSHWNQQSWLKYYMRYIVEQNKYFVYPAASLSTNASDAGEHCAIPNNDYQVPLLQGDRSFRFPKIEDAVKYDVYFERMDLNVFPELDGKKLLDLYGNRNNYADADILISTKCLPYKVIGIYELKYRPMELNCVMPVEGNGFYVYDLKQSAEAPKGNTDAFTRFDVKSIHWKKLLHLGFSEFKLAVKERLKR